jgi:hypothetical protein
MGLVDEAIAEFQLAAKDENWMLECSSMQGICFMDKGGLLAVKWFEKGLKAPNRSDEEYQGLHILMATKLGRGREGSTSSRTCTGRDTNFRESLLQRAALWLRSPPSSALSWWGDSRRGAVDSALGQLPGPHRGCCGRSSSRRLFRGAVTGSVWERGLALHEACRSWRPEPPEVQAMNDLRLIVAKAAVPVGAGLMRVAGCD